MKTVHGYASRGFASGEYKSWRKMKARCKDTKSRNAANYFHRGIKVCERWVNNFEAFLADMGHKPSSDCSLDRIDNNLGYCPENCRWASPHEQNRNKRGNVFFELNGEKLCQKDFADVFGVQDATIIAKVRKGYTTDMIIDFYEKKHNKKYRNTNSSLSEALKGLGHWFHSEKASFFSVGEILKHKGNG